MHPRTRQALSVVLLGLALGYIGYLVHGHLGAMKTSQLDLSASRSLAFLALLTASIALSTLYHVVLVRSLQGPTVTGTRLGLAYALGQIVRYLPGKIAGVLFEANYLQGRVTASTIALALLIQTFLGYAWAAAIAGTLLLCATLLDWRLLVVLAPAAVILWMAHRFGWVEQVLGSLPVAGRYLRESGPASIDSPTATRLTGLLVVNWLPFLAAWIVLSWPHHSVAEAITFGAAYLGASIVGTALVVVPSGAVVREAAFVWLGSRFGLPVAELLVSGVALRVALTAADLVNVALFGLAHAIGKRE